MRSLDFRRHHSKRIERKFFKLLRNYSWYSIEAAERRSKLDKNHRATCSCIMCGNPRRHWKELTMQEKKFKEIDINEEIIAG